MIQLGPHPPPRLPEEAAPAAPPAATPAHGPDEASVEAALTLAKLRLSLGQSPQMDKAVGQLLDLLA